MFGDQFPKEIIKKIENKFWKDTVRSTTELLKSLKITNIMHVHNMPLWYNSMSDIEFGKDCVKKGYHIISDMLNEKCEFLTLKDMKERGLNIHFLGYIRINRILKDILVKIDLNTPNSGP